MEQTQVEASNRLGTAWRKGRIICAVVAVIATLITGIDPVSAQADEVADTGDMIHEVSQIDDQVTVSEDLGAFTARNANGTVKIPKNTSLAVEMSVVEIKLPGKPTPGLLDGDDVIYPEADTDTDLVVRATDMGSQVLMVLHTEKSPQAFEFTTKLPKDGTLRMNPDGSISVWADVALQEPNEKELVEATEVGFFDIPWAVDAKGNPVDTHFEIRGNKIIQHVDHSDDATITYPIVADPSYKDYCGWVGCSRYIAITKTKSLYDTRFNSSWSGWGLIYSGICVGVALLTVGSGALACGLVAAYLLNDLVSSLEYAGQNDRCIVAQYNRQLGLGSTYNWTTASKSSNSRCHRWSY